MERHGSETFWVEGEGLLGEALGGREEGDAARALARAAGTSDPPKFRFSRMRPGASGGQHSDPTLRKLAQAMTTGLGGAAGIPAGFTYLGQFIDHDLTFDRTKVMLGVNVPAAELVQARSPSLDLDSLYGGGPNEPRSADFYEADGLHLKMGKTRAIDNIPAKDGFDLPRGAGNTAAKRRKAIIPDPRNDENLAVAQTHLAMIRFHNRVVDSLTSVPPSQRFAKAREKVTKHYQWMIRSDYLPRICAEGVVNDVFNNNKRKVFEPGADPMKVPTMPLEFAVAAFRLGHSMVRDFYNWNRVFDFGSADLGLLFRFSAHIGNLDGKQRLPSNWIADFRRLYFFGEANKPNLVVPAEKFNRAMRIDTRVAFLLRDLPGFPRDEDNLAFRNLVRARMVKLATGQQMRRFMANKNVRLGRKLTTAQLRDGRGGASLDGLTRAQRDAVLRDTPLWFYILREAEFNQGRLKGVGARIVAETFHRAIEGSRHSIVRDTAFRPSFGPNNKTFRMVDLLLFAFKGQKSLLAPLG
jgi:Animal haem peroxidase